MHPRKLELRSIIYQEIVSEIDVKRIVIGELTSNESSTLDKLIKFGLGIGIDRTYVVKIKDEIDSEPESTKVSAEQNSTFIDKSSSRKDNILRHMV